jgi:hypothetical protein
MAKLDLSPSHALFVLEQAYEDRKITRTDIDRYSREIKDEIQSLEERLRTLRDAAVDKSEGWVSSGKQAVKRAVDAVKPSPRRKRRANMPASAEVQASRQLQGKYIAAIRSVPKTQRAKYAKIAGAEGRQAAIDAIKKAKK